MVSRNTGIPTVGALTGCGIFLESVKVTERKIPLIGAKLEIFKWYEESPKSFLHGRIIKSRGHRNVHFKQQLKFRR